MSRSSLQIIARNDFWGLTNTKFAQFDDPSRLEFNNHQFHVLGNAPEPPWLVGAIARIPMGDIGLKAVKASVLHVLSPPMFAIQPALFDLIPRLPIAVACAVRFNAADLRRDFPAADSAT